MFVAYLRPALCRHVWDPCKRPAPPSEITPLSRWNAPRTPDSAHALVPAPLAPYRPFYGYYSAAISV